MILSEQSDQLIVDKLNWKGEAKKSGMQMGDIISNFKKKSFLIVRFIFVSYAQHNEYLTDQSF